VKNNRRLPPEPRLLPEHLWKSVGLEDRDGIISHPLGDDVTQLILTGAIPLAEAQAIEQRAERQREEFASALRRKR
jgi:hypothetical protein